MAKVLKWVKGAIDTAKKVGGAIIDVGKGLYEQYKDSKAAKKPEVQTPTTPTAPLTYEEYINQLRQTASTHKQATYADAESYRQKAISDAYSAYALNKADYGNTANALSQMGLSGSGYSDYINSQAYAQQRGEVQTARTNEMAMRQGADATYADYMRQLNQSQMQKAEADENERKTMYYQLWEGAQQGAYSAEAIEAIGNRMGLKYADIEALKGVIKKPTASGKTGEANETGGVEFELTDDESGEKSNITIVNAADVDKFIADGTIDNKQSLDAVNEVLQLTNEEYNAKLKAIQAAMQDRNAASIEERQSAGEVIEDEDLINEYKIGGINKAALSSFLAFGVKAELQNLKSDYDKATLTDYVKQNKQYFTDDDYAQLTKLVSNAQTSQDKAKDFAGSQAQYGSSDTAMQGVLANTIIDSVKKKQAEKRADLNYYNSKSGTRYSVTDKSTGHGINSASLTVGEKVRIQVGDSTTDAYLRYYAANKTVDALGDMGVGEIKEYNGYLYLKGKNKTFRLDKSDTASIINEFKFAPIKWNDRRGENVVLPGGLGGR